MLSSWKLKEGDPFFEEKEKVILSFFEVNKELDEVAHIDRLDFYQKECDTFLSKNGFEEDVFDLCRIIGFQIKYFKKDFRERRNYMIHSMSTGMFGKGGVALVEALRVKEDSDFFKEKVRIINLFFEIGGNEHIKDLKECKKECKIFLKEAYDEDISDLISIIDSQIIAFQTDDKERAQKCVSHIWSKLNLRAGKPSNNLTFYEIRFLTALMHFQSDVENVINLSETMLKKLDEDYRDFDDYIRVKMAININLLEVLVDAKFFNTNYKDKIDNLIIEKVREVILLNLKSGVNNEYIVGLATLYKEILEKDKIGFYVALILLRYSAYPYDESMEALLSFFRRKYGDLEVVC